MEKKAISIIALDPRAARSYGRDVEGLFGEVADVSVFSVMDGSAMGMLPHADLFAASTDAFGSPEELARHVPIDSQTMAVQASFRWQELRRLKELPAGSRVLFVNMTETMAREAIAQLEQFGITHVHWIPFYPGGRAAGGCAHRSDTGRDALCAGGDRDQNRRGTAGLHLRHDDRDRPAAGAGASAGDGEIPDLFPIDCNQQLQL